MNLLGLPGDEGNGALFDAPGYVDRTVKLGTAPGLEGRVSIVIFSLTQAYHAIIDVTGYIS